MTSVPPAPALDEADWRDLLGTRPCSRGPGADPASSRAYRSRLAGFLRTSPCLDEVRLDGASLLLHALTGPGRWAVPDLLRAGARPFPGEHFLIAVLTHTPSRWNLAFPRRLGLDECDSEGNTVLHHAVACPKPKAVDALLRAGAAVDVRNKKGATPLHLAMVLGDEPGARIRNALLAAGADATIHDAEGWSAFHTWLRRSPEISPPSAPPAASPGLLGLDPEGIGPLSRVLRAHGDLLARGRSKSLMAFMTAANPSPWLHLLVGMGASWDTESTDGRRARTDFHRYWTRLKSSSCQQGGGMREDIALWRRVLELDGALPQVAPVRGARARL